MGPFSHQFILFHKTSIETTVEQVSHRTGINLADLLQLELMFFFELHVVNAFLLLEDLLEIRGLLEFGLSNATAEPVVFVLDLELAHDCKVVTGSQYWQCVFLVLRKNALLPMFDFGQFFVKSSQLLLVIVLNQMAFLPFLEIEFHALIDWPDRSIVFCFDLYFYINQFFYFSY
jgi:hypothetical protein